MSCELLTPYPCADERKVDFWKSGVIVFFEEFVFKLPPSLISGNWIGLRMDISITTSK